MKISFTNRGFTFIEVIIVLAVIAMVSFVSAPMGIQFFNSQNIDSFQSQLADTLNRARSQSMAQKGDSQYGVCIINAEGQTTSYVLFKGSYSSCSSLATSGDNEVYPMIDDVLIEFTASQYDYITFDKHTGIPKWDGSTNAFGTTTLYWNGIQRTITIDTFGSIVEQ